MLELFSFGADNISETQIAFRSPFCFPVTLLEPHEIQIRKDFVTEI